MTVATKFDGRFEFAIAEIADALRVSKRWAEKRAEREAWPFGETPARGGMRRLYPMDGLPEEVRFAIVVRQRHEQEQAHHAAQLADTALQARIKAQWNAWLYAKGWRKAEAERRQDALFDVERVRRETGCSLTEARKRVAALASEAGINGRGVSALKRAANRVAGIPREYWLAFLLPEEKGSVPPAEIHPAALAAFKADWLRREKPDAASCYRRVQRLARVHPEWLPLPTAKTFQRRLECIIPYVERVHMREGEEASMRLGPKIRRDRGDLAALSIVNADGHTFDVAVTLPDGTIGRPLILGWQDVYSGKLLSYRIARSETADVVRLSFCDMVRSYGIPGRAHLDNGRAFAAKSNTGGVPTRYRYKVKAGDQLGVIARLGTDVRWVRPYNGKAKPVERAWRDLATDVSKRPEFAGAYLGNSPTTKPENYGSRAVPWDEFLRVVADGVAEYNARTGRRSDVADGRSLDETFAESYARATIRKATTEQLAMLLLASHVRPVSRDDGAVTLAGNRYWTEALCRHGGARVELRFDPEAMHDGVHVFSLDGTYLCKADCIAAIGWNTTEAMRDAQRREAAFRKARRAYEKAERERNEAVSLGDLPPIPGTPLPSPAAIAMFQPPRKPATAREDEPEAADSPEFNAMILSMLPKRGAL